MPVHTALAALPPKLLMAFGAIIILASAPAQAENVLPSAGTLLSVEYRYGPGARQRLEQWRRLIESSQEASDELKLQQANTFINRVEFVNDIDHWGVEDYWATPLQLLTSNGGDCEDFSIAKYYTLRQMGIPAERLRLTYVKAIDLNQAHMVLTYFQTPDSDPLVLDNLVPEIRRSSLRSDLQPVYSFNAEGLWLARERGTGKRVGKPERLSRWNEMIARINTEQTTNGF